MSEPSVVTLPSLLVSSYLIAYSVPLLATSLIVTFAGSFLTLDRTRSFPPLGGSSFASPRSKLSWRYEGGLGGTAGGFLCGMHLSTFLALLVGNQTSSSLGSIQFLVIWMLCGIVLAVLSSRWRLVALFSYSITGGASIAALIGVVFHPSITARLAVLGVFTFLLLALNLLPLPRVQHTSLRTSTAFTGALGLVESIALFKHVESWSSPWLTLIIKRFIGVRSGTEKGLSAAVCIFAIVGIVSDWLLKRYVGENPDKEWDAYLSKYSKGLPFDSERQGHYRPFPSLWTKVFGIKGGSKGARTNGIVFPHDTTLLPSEKIPTSPPPAPGFTPYSPIRKDGGHPTLMKTRPTLPVLSDSDSDSDNHDKSDGPPKFRPWIAKRSSTANSAATTVVGDGEKVRKTLTFAVRASPTAPRRSTEYSDNEESEKEQDVTATRVGSDDRGAPGWKPKFLKDHEEEKERLSIKSTSKTLDDAVRSESPDHLTSSSTTTLRSPPPRLDSGALAVPATPSLIRAVDRITQAQRDAFGSNRLKPPRMFSRVEGEANENGFWNEVEVKALQGERGRKDSKA